MKIISVMADKMNKYAIEFNKLNYELKLNDKIILTNKKIDKIRDKFLELTGV
jgi:hypothetical protein